MTRLIVVIFICLIGQAQDFSREMPPLIAKIPTPPVAVDSGGQFLLAYELHLTSFHSKNLILRRIEVLAPGPVATLEGESLAKAFAGRMPHKGVLPETQTTVVILAVLVARVPASIDHRIHFQAADYPEPLAIDFPGTAVSLNSLKISPPLHGDMWVAVNGPTGNNHHTGGLMPYRGRIHVPQRFAIDFVRVFEDGKTHRGEPKENRSYRAHGAEVLAVANAVVADVLDGIPENAPDPKKRAVPMTLDNVTGNRVVLDLGRGRFAHYAHLQPGSIRVRRGDRVRRGQVLALVGNSGNTTEPHLHFQISDSPAILQSDGLPFVFDEFIRSGKTGRNELPRDGWVLRDCHEINRTV